MDQQKCSQCGKVMRIAKQVEEHLLYRCEECNVSRPIVAGSRRRVIQRCIGELGAKPGRWKGGMKADHVRTASVSCPLCGRIAALSNHKITRDGWVHPSVVCPNEKCKFHEFVILEGWDVTSNTTG